MVPSLVSINNRGPVSGGGSVTGGSLGGLADLEDDLLAVVAGFGLLSGTAISLSPSMVAAVSFFSVIVSFGLVLAGCVLRVVGRRPRAVLGVVAVVFAEVVFSDGTGSAGLLSGVGAGVGSGVGAAATSRIGSSIRAPTEETRRVVLLPGVVVADSAGVTASDSFVSALRATGSNAPENDSW